MKPSTEYAAFDPASGEVVSHRGNQVEISIFCRGRSQMKLIIGYAAFDPASGDVVSHKGNPGRNVHLWQKSLVNETHHFYTSFKPASGGVVGHRENQVEMSFFGQGLTNET
jgi:hypothetical protein